MKPSKANALLPWAFLAACSALRLNSSGGAAVGRASSQPFYSLSIKFSLRSVRIYYRQSLESDRLQWAFGWEVGRKGKRRTASNER